MSLYVSVVENLVCPNCGSIRERLIFADFGDVGNFTEYRIGERVTWWNNRPENGTGDFTGWYECKDCDSENEPTIHIFDDIILSVE